VDNEMLPGPAIGPTMQEDARSAATTATPILLRRMTVRMCRLFPRCPARRGL
jgi:hypothetical protein